MSAFNNVILVTFNCKLRLSSLIPGPISDVALTSKHDTLRRQVL